MNTRGFARHAAVIAKLLISVSLFFSLVWWWVGAELFLAGAVASVAAALLEHRVPAVVAVPE